MAKGGGGGRNNGGKGGGKKTGRSQSYNYLRQFGYPSPRELRREAQGLASAAVPTVRQVSSPYNQQMRSTRDYLAAIQSALADTTAGVNQGYDASLQQSQGVDAAAQARLAGLGLGADSAGVQAATGAGGDSQTQALIANAAAAKHAAAQMPTIAAGAASQNQQVLQSKLLDALSNRRDQLSQAFFQALQQAQQQGLATAGFNQSQYQFQQNMQLQQQQMAQQQSQFAASQAQSNRSFNEQVREFNISRKDAKTAATTAGLSPSELRQQMSVAQGLVGAPAPQMARIPRYGPTGHINGYTMKPVDGQDTRDIAQKGTPFRDALALLIQNGVAQSVALTVLSGIYSKYANAPVYSPHTGEYSNAYKAYASYVHYLRPERITGAERRNTELTGPH